MIISGKARVFGDDIDTDAIIPARYLNTSEPAELAQHCLEDAAAGLPEQEIQGDIIVAGKNFGCGSSREHAPLAIKASGIGAVVAASFARIFYRNAFNIGLPIFESPDAVRQIGENDSLEIDPAGDLIRNLTTGEEYRAAEVPSFMSDILAAGGLIEYLRRQVKDNV